MRSGPDLLYTIFEQHLFNALVEDETADELLGRVVRDYVDLLSARGMILQEHLPAIESDLRDEVLEMLRKKTYGHFNLQSYRKAHGQAATQATTAVPQKAKARRSKRAC